MPSVTVHAEVPRLEIPSNSVDELLCFIAPVNRGEARELIHKLRDTSYRAGMQAVLDAAAEIAGRGQR